VIPPLDEVRAAYAFLALRFDLARKLNDALGAAVWVPPGSGRFRAGMYATASGPLHVSRGIGTSVVPARLTCRPELPIFRLVAA
jgi:hypothetical protein